MTGKRRFVTIGMTARLYLQGPEICQDCRRCLVCLLADSAAFSEPPTVPVLTPVPRRADGRITMPFSLPEIVAIGLVSGILAALVWNLFD